MKKCIAVLSALIITLNVTAQSKVFKEVNDDISSTFKVITQDNALVGYLVFSKLEKASKDSFNYKISIMDENLNEIGVVNFKEENLNLFGVSFEQDILCLAYLKSNVIGTEYKSNRDFKRSTENNKAFIFSQFLGLDGKIIKTNAIKADVDVSAAITGNYFSKRIGIASLNENIQLSNIPQKGFACFYGDKNGNYLVAYSTTGTELWKKKITDADDFAMLTSGNGIYILSKTKQTVLQGGYYLNGYSATDGAGYDKLTLQDREGNWLRVLSFENDPVTGKPVIAGNVINSKKGKGVISAADLTSGLYSGVFTININGPKKADIQQVFTYWNDGSQSYVTEKGRFEDNGSYSTFSTAFRDYQGNTYFAGSSVIHKTKWGTIASSVILSPLIIISPIILGASGTQKCKVENAMVIKQNAKGVISFDNTIPCNSTGFVQGRMPLSLSLDTKSFYKVTNSENKLNYLIVDDVKDIVIYNVTQRKIIRTIPHKNGQIRTNIFPAKEGHMMVYEYNKKEKYTRLSIESL